jgi:hypothetical protein
LPRNNVFENYQNVEEILDHAESTPTKATLQSAQCKDNNILRKLFCQEEKLAERAKFSTAVANPLPKELLYRAASESIRPTDITMLASLSAGLSIPMCHYPHNLTINGNHFDFLDDRKRSR